jgi:cytochrome c1
MRRHSMPWVSTLIVLAAASAMIVLTLDNRGEQRRQVDSVIAITHGGDPKAGEALILSAGCGSCHMVPGVTGARGTIAPSLAGFGSRTTVAGVLANAPDNLEKWLQDPRSIDAKTAMPDLDLSSVQARDISAYLYLLR